MRRSRNSLSARLAVADGLPDPVTARIREAAREEFEMVGIRRCNIVDIARRAGVSRATLYRRFPDRDTLVNAVVTREAMQGLALIDSELGGVDDPGEAMVRIGVGALRLLRAHPLLNRLLETEPEELYHYAVGNAGDLVAIAREFVVERIAARQAVGGPPATDIALAAELLVRLVISLLLTPEGVIPVADDDKMAELFRQYLRPLPTGDAPAA